MPCRGLAEIRAGELLAAMAKGGERQKQGKPKGITELPLPPTLKSIGVTKTQSSRWQKLAALPEEAQDEIIARTSSRTSSTHRSIRVLLRR